MLHHFILWRAAPGGTVQDAWIDGWAAGVAPRELPAGTARLLPKGRNLLGDFHYHPSGTASTDQTRVGVWFAEPDEVEKELVNLWIMNSAFTIPAGDPNHEARAHHDAPRRPSRTRLPRFSPAKTVSGHIGHAEAAGERGVIGPAQQEEEIGGALVGFDMCMWESIG